MSTKTVDIHDKEAELSELVSLALEGNDVIIAEGDKPLARFFLSQDQNKPAFQG